MLIGLSWVLPPDDLEEKLARARKSKGWAEKAWAELPKFGDRAVPGLAAIMKDKSLAAPRYIAAICLGKIGTEKAAAVLIEGLASDSLNVRRFAARELGKLGVEKARPKIKKLAETDPFKWKDPRTGETRYLVRIMAKDALAELDRAARSRELAANLALLGSEVRWERDIQTALDRARREKKLILAAVKMEKYGGKKGEAPRAQGMVFHFMLASLFTGTEIVDLVNRRFVPLQVGYNLVHRTIAIQKTNSNRPMTGDPLEKLGTNTRLVKPQALLVVSPEGKLIAMLNGMAAYDPGIVHRFLRARLAQSDLSKPRGKTLQDHFRDGELKKAKEAIGSLADRDEANYRTAQLEALRGNHEKAVDALKPMARSSRWYGPGLALKGISLMRTGKFSSSIRALRASIAKRKHARVPEATYWLGCVLERSGQREQAVAFWRKLVSDFPQSPFAWKARLRLRNEAPYFDEYESILSFAVPGKLNGTEYAVERKKLRSFIGYPIDFLLRQQQPSGFWRNTQEHADKFGGFGYKTAITSLSLMALMQWEEMLEGPRRKAVKGALERGTKAILESMDEIRATSKTFDFTYVLWFLLRRYETTQDRKLRAHVQKAVDGLAGAQYEDGGWGYCNRTTSFNTGPALFLLARAKKQGFRVDDAVVERGIRVLQKMRVPDGVFHYTLKKGFHWMSKPSMTTGRAPICAAALLLHGKARQGDVARTIDGFLKYEGELRKPVKVYYDSCSPDGHAGYHYFFAYHNAVTAVRALGDEGRGYLDRFYGGILSYVELDNTWVDNHSYGKVYGTSMAVLILGELESSK